MSESFESLVDLLTGGDFLLSVFFGSLGLVVLFGMSKAGVQRGWALSVVATTVVAISVVIGPNLTQTIGLSVLALGGYLLMTEQGSANRFYLGIGVLLAGGYGLVAIDGASLPRIIWVVSPLIILVLGWILSFWDGYKDQAMLGWMFAISAFAIWTTIPDTDAARLLLGASIPLALATRAPMSLRMSGPGAFALVGLVGWLAISGGYTRLPSIIGAFGTIIVILLIPLVEGSPRPMPTFILHGAVVFLAARVIGLWHSGLAAALALAVLVVATFYLMGLLTETQHQSANHGPS